MNTPTTKSAEQRAREVFNRIFKNVSPWTEKEGLAELAAIIAERDSLLKQRDLACRLLTGEVVMTDQEMQAAGLGAGTNIEQRHRCHQLQSQLTSLKSVAGKLAEGARHATEDSDSNIDALLTALTAYDQWRKENE